MMVITCDDIYQIWNNLWIIYAYPEAGVIRANQATDCFFNVSLDVPNDVLAAKDVPNMFIKCY